MARALPILSEGYEVTYDADLSDTAVRCTFTWLERTRSWYLDVALPDGTVVVKGRRIGAKRTPLEGLRILHLIGDSEVLIPIGADPYLRSSPPSVILVPRPAAAQVDDSLTITAGA